MPQPPPSNRHVRAWLDDWELPAPPRVQPLTGGFTSHVWRIDVGESVYVAKLAYQPRAEVENGLQAAAVLARHGLRTGPARLTRAGQLTRLVEYPAGHWQALSLLRFVEGQPLDWRSTEALRIAGNTLGTIHRVLMEDGAFELPDQLFCYLVDHNAGGCQPDLQPIVARAVAVARSFEAECPVTYGPIYGDALQVRVDTRDGSIGLIDWGTVSRGPLLFDLALAVHAAQRAGHVNMAELFAPLSGNNARAAGGAGRLALLRGAYVGALSEVL